MKIPQVDFEKFVELFGMDYANNITYDEYINFWQKTTKQLRDESTIRTLNDNRKKSN